MFKKKRSLFERLTGGVALDEDFDAFEDERIVQEKDDRPSLKKRLPLHDEDDEPLPAEPESIFDEPEGQLPVDVYQSTNEIIIRTFVAGVRADSLDISISRDMVTISGAREAREEIDEGNYYHKELYWGSFTRTILLPEEIDVESSSASAKDGMLTLILPKLDKKRQTKLKVKSG